MTPISLQPSADRTTRSGAGLTSDRTMGPISCISQRLLLIAELGAPRPVPTTCPEQRVAAGQSGAQRDTLDSDTSTYRLLTGRLRRSRRHRRNRLAATSKLRMRVRFPSSAPENPCSEAVLAVPMPEPRETACHTGESRAANSVVPGCVGPAQQGGAPASSASLAEDALDRS